MTGLCQLAGGWKGDLPPGGAMCEQKHDGHRMMRFAGIDDITRLWSRNGMPIDGCGHIARRLALMERAAGEPLFIDGELVVAGTLAATKAWVERGWKGGGEAGTFHAFDVLSFRDWRNGGSDVPLYQRKKRLAELIEAADALADDWEWAPGSRGRDEGSRPVVLVPDEWCETPGDVLALANRVWAENGEGLMVKDAMAGYSRKRSDAWQKIKAENRHKWMCAIGAHPISA